MLLPCTPRNLLWYAPRPQWKKEELEIDDIGLTIRPTVTQAARRWNSPAASKEADLADLARGEVRNDERRDWRATSRQLAAGSIYVIVSERLAPSVFHLGLTDTDGTQNARANLPVPHRPYSTTMPGMLALVPGGSCGSAEFSYFPFCST